MIFLVNLQRCPQISELKVPCRACRSCFFRSSIIFNAISFSVSAPLRPPLSTIPVAHVLDVNYWRQPTTAVKVPSPTTPRSEIATKHPPFKIVHIFNSLWVWFFLHISFHFMSASYFHIQHPFALSKICHEPPLMAFQFQTFVLI